MKMKLLAGLAFASAFSAVVVGTLTPLTPLVAQTANNKAAEKPKAQDFRELEEFLSVYKTVKARYVDQVTDEQLMQGAIQGMLSNLDAHSGFLNKSDFQGLTTQIDGEYKGLGLSVTMEDGVVKVIAPTADTPADRAGIKAGDYITHLDGKLIYGGTLDEAVEAMRGEAGTSIKLTLVRVGRDQPFDVTVTRAKIDLKSVKYEVKDNIAIIALSNFAVDTADDMVKAIRTIQKQHGNKLVGYIIDLRSNPGGVLDAAVAVSDAFLADGEIVSERGRDTKKIERWYAEEAVPGDVTMGKPVIVLVDVGSASASEIVAGALQDHHRALIIGETSFGKGSVQNVISLPRQTGLRLTVARYHLPSGRSIQEGGVKPDIRVPQLSDPDYKKRVAIREADLRRHLINELQADDKQLEEDNLDDPRFNQTAEQLKAKGIDDFQLHYAMDTLKRLGTKTMRVAEKGAKGPAHN